jgi:hypothetical protein
MTMLLATMMLALSVSAASERNCVAPAQTGTFRITAVAKDSTSAKVGMVLLENVANCLEASLLVQDSGPTFIDNVTLNGDVLTGELKLLRGTAKVMLKLSSTDIKGSITEGKHVWQISGRRTSGETRVASSLR